MRNLAVAMSSSSSGDGETYTPPRKKLVCGSAAGRYLDDKFFSSSSTLLDASEL